MRQKIVQNCIDHEAAIAFIGPFGGEKRFEVSFLHLGQAIIQFEHTFRSRAPTPVIGILSTRRAEAYLSVLASYINGIRFVPLNPKLPVERLERIVTLAGVTNIIFEASTETLCDQLSAPCIAFSEICSEMDEAPNLERLLKIATRKVPKTETAYQMFTSGSTGDPKGVPLNYQSIDNYIPAICHITQMLPQKRFSHVFDIGFDLAINDIFMAAFSKGCLVAASDLDLMMPERYLIKSKIDYWNSVPTLAALAIVQGRAIERHHKIQKAIFCGEALSRSVSNEFAELFGVALNQVWNIYGPTETNVVTFHNCGETPVWLDIEPLGIPIPNCSLAIDRGNKGLCQVSTEGAEGELLLGGTQVFDGYKPDVGKNPFMTFQGQKFYRSGDIVRISRGQIEFIGRSDAQVKVRGYRIDLGDIEAMFRKCFGTNFVACGTYGKAAERRVWLVYEAKSEISDISPLSELLPSYMMPSIIERLDQLPRNPNGKIDRKSIGKRFYH